jgi:hypothetical protein
MDVQRVGSWSRRRRNSRTRFSDESTFRVACVSKNRNWCIAQYNESQPCAEEETRVLRLMRCLQKGTRSQSSASLNRHSLSNLHMTISKEETSAFWMRASSTNVVCRSRKIAEELAGLAPKCARKRRFSVAAQPRLRSVARQGFFRRNFHEKRSSIFGTANYSVEDLMVSSSQFCLVQVSFAWFNSVFLVQLCLVQFCLVQLSFA